MGHDSGTRIPLLQSLFGSRNLTVAFAWLITGSMSALILVAPLANAQVAAPTAQATPENASPKSYGDGWECDIGYRLLGEACAAIVVPQNAYETRRSYGSGWECQHGYRLVDDVSCVAVAVPEGGYLDPSGERWKCLRGFVRFEDTCQEILVPENAYLAESYSGSSWECDRGYEAKGNECVALVVPANAYMNTSKFGQPWTCERGFVELRGLCNAVKIPENAYFVDTSYGDGWKCERGFAASEQKCEAIAVPTNAHLDRSGNRWECDKNFQKSINQCVPNN